MKKSKIILIFIIALLLTFTSVITATYGKYIYNSFYEKYLETKNFYFESNELSLNGKKYDMTDWNEKIAFVIPITLKNYINEYAYTNDNIAYSVEVNCPNTVSCITDLAGNIGSLEGGHKTDKSFNVTVSMNEELDSGDVVEFSVTVKSTKPYKKKLTAKFSIKISDFAYLIEDKSNQKYFLLQLLNAKEEDHIYHLSFDPTLISIDMTNKLVMNASNKQYKNNLISGLDISVSANKSTEIIFYKKDPTKDYTFPIINKESIITIK